MGYAISTANAFQIVGKIQNKELIKKLIEKLKEARLTIKAKYPATIDTKGKQALYDNLGKDETLGLSECTKQSKQMHVTVSEIWIAVD